jgi:hypothetical protein
VTNSYMIDHPINVIRGQRHVILAVGRYETSDMEIIRLIHSYPNVRFLGSVPTPAVTCAGGYAPAPLPATEPAVKTTFGQQMPQRRPHGPRVADSE